MRPLFLAILVVLALPSCKEKAKHVDGIAQWHLGKSTLAEGFVCRPFGDGLSYCSNNPEITMGGSPASIDLYFRGVEESAPLVEILASVNACHPDAIFAELKGQLGEPDELHGTVAVWRRKLAFIVGQLPAPDGVCEINVVDPTETKRVEELMKLAQPSSP